MHLPCQVVLHGAQFHDTPIRIGDRVLLAHEPTNPVDPRAVQATSLGGPLGYLPAKVAARALAEHGTGCRFAAEVTAVSESPRRITVRVTTELERLATLPATGPADLTPASAAAVTAPCAPSVVRAASPAPTAGPRRLPRPTPTALPRHPVAVGEPVYSRSGRHLGVVLGLAPDSALVVGPNGECRYPLGHLVGRPESDA